MKFYIHVIAILVVALLVSNLNAAKVYTWTDEKGKLHISEEPPPKNTKVKDVIDYQPKAEKKIGESDALQEEGNAGPLVERKRQEARDAREQAEKATREAQAAQTKANQAVEKANEYISTHNRNQYMRRAHKYEMRKVSDEAKTAQEQARVATEKAHKAEKRAQAAEEEARRAAALPAD
jgi:uncharacterized membrane protein